MRLCDSQNLLRSKTRIVPKPEAANIPPVVARSGGAGEIAKDKITAWVATGILGRDVKLLLSLEAPMDQLKAIRGDIPQQEVRRIAELVEIVYVPKIPVAVPLAIHNGSNLQRLVLS